jgi:hypothetical protein
MIAVYGTPCAIPPVTVAVIRVYNLINGKKGKAVPLHAMEALGGEEV